MVPSALLFQRKRTIPTRTGTLIVVFLELYDIIQPNTEGLFLGKYKISWIAFDPQDPMHRVLMDCHAPIGIHYHVDDQERVPASLSSLQEAFLFFEQRVIERFGELEERIYEDIHI